MDVSSPVAAQLEPPEPPVVEEVEVELVDEVELVESVVVELVELVESVVVELVESVVDVESLEVAPPLPVVVLAAVVLELPAVESVVELPPLPLLADELVWEPELAGPLVLSLVLPSLVLLALLPPAPSVLEAGLALVVVVESLLLSALAFELPPVPSLVLVAFAEALSAVPVELVESLEVVSRPLSPLLELKPRSSSSSAS